MRKQSNFTHRLNSFQISRIVLLVLSRSPAYGARGFHAFLTDSCNKAFSSDWLHHLLEKHLDWSECPERSEAPLPMPSKSNRTDLFVLFQCWRFAWQIHGSDPQAPAVSGLFFFRDSRIFCPKAVKSSIGIIIHLKYILSCRFAQRNNLIIPVNRLDYADLCKGLKGMKSQQTLIN